ncbi:MAG TPA: hypothetical protein VGR89_06515, partial [Puia sp.]|nr:hypothetical protein [Puia sp.]
AALSAPAGTFLGGIDIILPGEKNTVLISAYARERLGLTDIQACYLFSPLRTREEVTEALEHIAVGHPEEVKNY